MSRARALRIVPVLALSLGLGVPSAPAAEAEREPDVATILRKLQEARGGKARWDAAKTLRIEGIWTAFSENVPMTVSRMRPGRFRFDHRVLGSPAVLAYDGAKAWVQGEAYGAPDGQALEEDWKRNVIDEAPFGPLLLEHASRGAKIELRGKEQLEGRQAWVLAVTGTGMPDETWWIDAETFLESKRLSRTFDLFSGPGVELEMETYYMNFRDVSGLVLPFREERHFGTRYLVYEARSVEVDSAIDEAVFRVPVPAADKPSESP